MAVVLDLYKDQYRPLLGTEYARDLGIPAEWKITSPHLGLPEIIRDGCCLYIFQALSLLFQGEWLHVGKMTSTVPTT
eukprot:9016603-Ditylum_brightwellii.AAC.1